MTRGPFVQADLRTPERKYLLDRLREVMGLPTEAEVIRRLIDDEARRRKITT